MEDKKILLDNIVKIHTTEMGIDRIKITVNSYSYTIITAHKVKQALENHPRIRQAKGLFT